MNSIKYLLIKKKSNVINNWDWAFIDLVTWLKDVQLWYNHKFDLSLSYLPILRTIRIILLKGYIITEKWLSNFQKNQRTICNNT